MFSSKQQILAIMFAIVAMFSQVQAVKADAGDVIAILLGVFIGLVAICAFIGWYSKRGQQDSSAIDEEAQ